MNKVPHLTAILLVIAAALVLAWFRSAPPVVTAPDQSTAQTAAPALAANPPPTATAPPDLAALAGRLGAGAIPPTPEQLEEERRVEQEQVAFALRALGSPDAGERVGGAQQLSAYPTREAEQHLTRALTGDKSAAVRAAAAASLAFIKEPRPDSIKALLGAVQDRDAEVRDTALQTLAGCLNGLPSNSPAYWRIYRGLAGLAQSGRLAPATRAAIKQLLADFAA
jgi:hypothetical protein